MSAIYLNVWKVQQTAKVKQRSVDFTGIEENQIMSGICKSFVIFQPTHLSRDMCGKRLTAMALNV